MKIGVFGDSFADKSCDSTAWWQQLKQHGHYVSSHGESGSSINFSAKMIYDQYKDWDLMIWCMTTPGRFSVDLPDGTFHSTKAMSHTGQRVEAVNLTATESLVADVCQKYLKYVFDYQTENIIGRALAHYFLDKIHNLMIIPCFRPPLDSDFNLYDLCNKELQKFFPDKEVHEIYQSWQDIRACHISSKNNKILADLICADLKPGIFTADYSDFDFEDISLDQMLRKL